MGQQRWDDEGQLRDSLEGGRLGDETATADFGPDLTGQPLGRITKISEIGTGHPLWARLFFGVLQFRDRFVDFTVDQSRRDAARTEFDERYAAVVNPILSAHQTAQQFISLIEEHRHRIEVEQDVRFQPGAYEIDGSSQTAAQERFAAVLMHGVVALKALQHVTKFLGLDIGFFYKKSAPFQAGLVQLRSEGRAELATYLNDVRTSWSGEFIDLRAKCEHNGWVLPAFDYVPQPGPRLQVCEPMVLGRTATEYARASVNRLSTFCEEVTICSLALRFPPPLLIREIPPSERDPVNVYRFVLDVRRPGVVPWTLSHREQNDFL